MTDPEYEQLQDHLRANKQRAYQGEPGLGKDMGEHITIGHGDTHFYNHRDTGEGCGFLGFTEDKSSWRLLVREAGIKRRARTWA